MPPKIKTDREMILNAAFDILREYGCENMNARTISQRLGCSTQPVLYQFKTIEEIKAAVYQKADQYHSEYLMNIKENGNPLLEIGMNYIRFGNQEKNLFRFLFQSNHFAGSNIQALAEDEAIAPFLGMIAKAKETDMARAKEVFLTMFALAHGIASLLANNGMEYNEEQIQKILESVFK